MVKFLSATTLEVDDASYAVEEILAQLDLENNLLKNSVGLVSCYAEYIETDVYQAICKKLPFDVIGTTTIANAVNGDGGRMMLGVTVLTSDTVEFSVSLSEKLNENNVDKVLASAYNAAAGKYKEKAKFGIVYAPLIQTMGGDMMVSAIDRASNGVPIFGTLALDHTLDYHLAQVLYNGKAYTDRLAMVLLYGDVSADFYVASISADKIQKQKAIITKSNRNILMEVNGLNARDYLDTLGLVSEKGIEGANVIPFVVDYNDGTSPVARAIYGMTDDGFAVCGGEMPESGTLAIGHLDMTDVLETAKKAVSALLADDAGLLMFSCLSRHLVLAADFMAEIYAVNDVIDASAPYQLCYSGGEICPMYDASGKAINKFHNDTIVVCRIK